MQIERQFLAVVGLDDGDACTPGCPAQPQPQPGRGEVRRAQGVKESGEDFGVDVVGVPGTAAADLRGEVCQRG